jgi:hypothetical protein
MTGIFEIAEEDLKRQARRDKSLDDYRRKRAVDCLKQEAASFFHGPGEHCLRPRSRCTPWFFKTDEDGVVQSYLDGTPLLTQICNLISGESYD